MRESCTIIGATSGIGSSTALKFAENGYDLILTGRDITELESISKSITDQYSVSVKSVIFELNQSDISIDQLFHQIKFLEQSAIIITIGMLETEYDSKYQSYNSLLDTNFIGPALIIQKFRELLVDNLQSLENNISLIVISSVAGNKGKSSNYLYGATKSALTTYLSGIRQELYHISKKIHVCTVIPGFVNTKMTRGMRLPKYLVSSKSHVANRIFDAFKKKKEIIYIKKTWRLIMLLINLIPEYIFKKLKL